MMKNKIIALLGAALLVSACSDSGSDNMDVTVHAAPGSAADFKANRRDRVFFDFNQATLSADAKKISAEQATWLKTYPATKATIEGHCDVRGTADFNRALGAKRAAAAKQQLVKDGVAADRLKTISYGKDRPLVPGTTDVAHAQNRVAVTVVE